MGFYATLDRDFWHVWRHYFPDTHSWLTSYVPFAFWVGSRLSLPRLQVLKYTAMASEEDLQAIRARNKLDIALYEWALARFRFPTRTLPDPEPNYPQPRTSNPANPYSNRPGLRFYDSYSEWMADHRGSVAAVASGVCLALACCCACCRFLCRLLRRLLESSWCPCCCTRASPKPKVLSV